MSERNEMLGELKRLAGYFDLHHDPMLRSTLKFIARYDLGWVRKWPGSTAAEVSGTRPTTRRYTGPGQPVSRGATPDQKEKP
jgi:hypothetical protein